MKPNLVRKLELRKRIDKGKDSFKNPFTMFNKRSQTKKQSVPDNEYEMSPKSTVKDEKNQLLEAEMSPAFGKIFIY